MEVDYNDPDSASLTKGQADPELPITFPSTELESTLIHEGPTDSDPQTLSLKGLRKIHADKPKRPRPINLGEILQKEPVTVSSGIQIEQTDAPKESNSIKESASGSNLSGPSLTTADFPLGSYLKRVGALQWQQTDNCMKKIYRFPSTFVEVETLYKILSRKIRSVSPQDDVDYDLLVHNVHHEFSNSNCIKNMRAGLSDMDQRRAIAQGFYLNFMKSSREALWVFLPLLGSELESNNFLTYFKKRDFCLLFLEEYRDFLAKRVEGSMWSVEPYGYRSLTQEFLSTVGNDLYKLTESYDDIDDRLGSSFPIKKKAKANSSIENTNEPKSNHSNMIVQQAHDCTLKDLDKKSIEDFLHSVRKNQVQFPGWCFDTELLTTKMSLRLDNVWLIHSDIKPGMSWRDLDEDNFLRFIERIPSSTDGRSQKESILAEMHRQMRGLFFNPLNILATLDQLVDFQKTLNDNEITLTSEEKKNIDQIIFDGLVYQHCSDNIKNIIKTLKSTLVYSDTSQEFDLLKQAAIQANEADILGQKALDIFNVTDWAAARRGKADSAKNHQPRPPKGNHKHHNKRGAAQQSTQAPTIAKGPNKPCYACGMDNHVAEECRFLSNSTIKRSLLNLNKNITFAESARGKYLVSLGYPPRYNSVENLPALGKPEANQASKKQRPNGTYGYLNTLSNLELPLIDVFIAAQGNRKPTKAQCLLDSGADVCYVSLNTVDSLEANNYIIPCINCITCTAASDTCHSIAGIINLTISYINELGQHLTIKVRAHVVNDLKYDCIIGRNTIKKHNLILQFPQHFLDLKSIPRYWDFQAGRGCGRTAAAKLGTHSNDFEILEPSSAPEETAHPLCVACSSLGLDATTSTRKPHNGESANPSCVVCSSLGTDATTSTRRTHDGEPKFLRNNRPDSANGNNTLFHLNSLNRSSRSDYEKEDIHEIRDDQMEAIPGEMLGIDGIHGDEIPTEIHGPPFLQAKLRKLITEYKDIFSRKVTATPARLPPFNFTVDEEKWKVHKNRTSPRRYDSTKSAALQKIVEQLLDLGVIEPSDAAYYSHGFPVPKSTTGAWRLVLDLKNLNKISSTEAWPIPNIKELLNRLGTHQASYFAVMDLTMGYHQAPIDPSCKKFTAFRTDTGLYQWNRLAMGLQGAGSYFQRVMSTVVLPRLIHSICELYLDDCIVPGQDEDSFVSRLEQVFTRFREFGITLHPDKCRFGLSEVEYVGVKISKEGTHFTRSKLDSILDFKEPATQGELKSFLGFANWFRDHVREYHSMSGPLHAMLSKYNRRIRLKWSEFTRNCYENLKMAIHECPQLYFLDEDSPIFLHTDASDYGVGAYLFQVVDGTQRPIAFLSKSLNERMRRWDTPQKEGFAIFYALDKFDYLLRDRKFTVRTDHANLTKLREDYTSNKKVQRWLTCFQHYDITFEYIKGSMNVVADTLSRHCINNFSLRDINTNLNTQVLAIPAKYVSWLTEAHNSVVGHHGVENTLAKLSVDRPDWPDRAKHVRMFIANCPTCQKMDQRKANVQAHPTTASSYRPNQRIAVDYIERLTPDQNGNTSILVIIDCFTRYVELYPVKAINAITSADCLLDWFTRYGAPNEISHDNGTSFVNQTLVELKKLVGSNSKIATAYSKEENPIVERANKEVMRHLRNIIFDENVILTWATHVPLVRRIMNSSIHAATGFTPASLMFGNAIDIDKGFLFPNKLESNPEVPYTLWSAQRLSAHSTLLDVARQNLTERDEVHMLTYPTGRSDFDINSYVLVEHRQNNLRRGPSSKLLPFLKGPLRVLAKADNTYTLQDIVTMRTYEYHIKNLRVFNFDPNSQNPLTYALKDDGTMYQVDYISKHKGDPKKGKNQLQFLVHWVGYDESTWEPWSHVRRNIKLHEYLRTHKVKAVRDLLPDNFDIDTHVFSDEEK